MKREIKLTKDCAKNPLRSRIAEVLVRCMEIRGETSHTIAEKTGISRRTIDRWTHGNGLTVDGLDIVFDVLGFQVTISSHCKEDSKKEPSLAERQNLIKASGGPNVYSFEERIIDRLSRKEETWGPEC